MRYYRHKEPKLPSLFVQAEKVVSLTLVLGGERLGTNQKCWDVAIRVLNVNLQWEHFVIVSDIQVEPALEIKDGGEYPSKNTRGFL